MRGEERKKRDLKTNTLGQIKIKILTYEKFSSQKANISSLFLSRFSFFFIFTDCESEADIVVQTNTFTATK